MASPLGSNSSGDTAILAGRKLSLSSLGNGPRTYRRHSRTMLSEGPTDIVVQKSPATTLFPSSILLQPARRVSTGSTASSLYSSTNNVSFTSRKSDSLSNVFSHDPVIEVGVSSLEVPFPNSGAPILESHQNSGARNLLASSMPTTTLSQLETASPKTTMTSSKLSMMPPDASMASLSFPSVTRSSPVTKVGPEASEVGVYSKTTDYHGGRRGSYSDVSTVTPDIITSSISPSKLEALKSKEDVPAAGGKPQISATESNSGGTNERVRRKSKFMSKFAPDYFEKGSKRGESGTSSSVCNVQNIESDSVNNVVALESPTTTRVVGATSKQSTNKIACEGKATTSDNGSMNRSEDTGVKTDRAWRITDTLMLKDLGDHDSTVSSSPFQKVSEPSRNLPADNRLIEDNKEGVYCKTQNNSIPFASATNAYSHMLQKATDSDKNVISPVSNKYDVKGNVTKDESVEPEREVETKTIDEMSHLPIIRPVPNTGTSRGRAPLSFLSRRQSADTVDAATLQLLKPLSSPVSSVSSLQSTSSHASDSDLLPSDFSKSLRRPSAPFSPRRSSEPAPNLEADISAFRHRNPDIISGLPSRPYSPIKSRHSSAEDDDVTTTVPLGLGHQRDTSSPTHPLRSRPIHSSSLRRNSLSHQFLSDGIATVLSNDPPLSGKEFVGAIRSSSSVLPGVHDSRRNTIFESSVDLPYTNEPLLEMTTSFDDVTGKPRMTGDSQAFEKLLSDTRADDDVFLDKDFINACNYDNYPNIHDLQRKLSLTSDPSDRQSIRDLIRRLRRDAVNERLKHSQSSKSPFASGFQPPSQHAAVSRSQSFNSTAERNHAFLSSLAKVSNKTQATLSQESEPASVQAETYDKVPRPRNAATSPLSAFAAGRSIKSETGGNKDAPHRRPLHESDSSTQPTTVDQGRSSTSSVLEKAKARLNSSSLGTRKEVDDQKQNEVTYSKILRNTSPIAFEKYKAKFLSDDDDSLNREKGQTESASRKYRELRQQIVHGQQTTVGGPLARSSPIDDLKGSNTSHNDTVHVFDGDSNIEHRQFFASRDIGSLSSSNDSLNAAPDSPTKSGSFSKIPIPLKSSPSPKLKRHDAFFRTPDSPRSSSYFKAKGQSSDHVRSYPLDSADFSTVLTRKTTVPGSVIGLKNKNGGLKDGDSFRQVPLKPLTRGDSDSSDLSSSIKQASDISKNDARIALTPYFPKLNRAFQSGNKVESAASRLYNSDDDLFGQQPKVDEERLTSASSSLVSSLSSKFSEFREELDREESKLKSFGLRRTASLNSKVNNALKPETEKKLASATSSDTRPSTDDTQSGTISHDTKFYEPHILQPKQSVKTFTVRKDETLDIVSHGDSVSRESYGLNGKEEEEDPVTLSTDLSPSAEYCANDLNVSNSSIIDDAAKKSSLNKCDNEEAHILGGTVEADKNERNTAFESISEVVTDPPEKELSEIPEKKVSSIDIQIKAPRQRKIGIIQVGSLHPVLSFNEEHADTSPSIIRNEPRIRGDNNADDVDKLTPLSSNIGLERITVSSAYSGLSAKQAGNRSPSKDGPTLALNPARVKRFSTPIFGSVSDRTKFGSSLQAAESESQRRKSEIHNRRPAETMEEAFSCLLDDLDKVTGSDENASGSDFDLSDGDDLLTLSGGSTDFTEGIKKGSVQNGEAGSTVTVHKPDLLSSSKTIKKEKPSLINITLSDFPRIDKDVNLVKDVFPTPVDESNEDEDEVDYKDVMTSNSSPRVQASSSTDSWSKEDSGIGLGLDDSPVSWSKEDFKKRGLLHSLSSPGPTSSLTPTTQTKEVTVKDPKVKLMDTCSSPPDNMEGSDDIDHTIMNDNQKASTRGHRSMVIFPTSYSNHQHHNGNDNDDNDKDIDTLNSNNTLNIAKNGGGGSGGFGTRSFEVTEDADGTYTMRAEVEDANENRAVTVRTKTTRTPSNAKEELRDTVVEKKILSPGGSVVQERDVIHTRKRLTHRGSNYYHRTAYTTTKHMDEAGGETVMYNVQVEEDSQSVSQGQAWNDKVTSRMMLADESTSGKAIMAPGSENVADGRIAEADLKEAIPEIVQALKDVTTTEGKTVALECLVVARPLPEVTWLKDGDPLADTDDYVVRFEEDTGKATLLIASVTLFDTATFTCRCHNGMGDAETRCRVLVKRRPVKPPEFDKKLSDLEVTEGHSITMVCEVLSAGSVAWYKDGIIQRNSSDFKQTFDGREARLEIGEVFLDDIGEYSCVAKNEIGEERSSCRLNVNACGSETTVVPMFLTKLHNRDVSDGETLILECDVIGSPEPTIKWLIKGEAIRDEVSFSTSYDGRVARLEVTCLSTEDAGVYTCVAENPAGKVSMDSNVTVTVRNKAPYFQKLLESVTVKAGRNAVLTCHVTGSPPPDVLWRKNGMLIGSVKNTLQSFNGGVARMEILGVSAQDGGSYECVAKNIVSEITCSCHVTVEDAKAPTPEDPNTTADPALPKVRRRTFKKLSEPRPADIITSVLRRAASSPTGNAGVQRAQSFSPSSSALSPPSPGKMFQGSPLASVHDGSISEHSSTPAASSTRSNDEDQSKRLGRSMSTTSHSHRSSPGEDKNPPIASAAPQRPETLSVTRNSISVVSRKSLPSSSFSPITTSTPHSSAVTETATKPLSTISTSKPSVSVVRSASMHVLRSNKLSPNVSPASSQHQNLNIVLTSKAVDDETREITAKPLARAVSTELSPSARIPGFRSVSPMFMNSPRDESKDHLGSSSSLSTDSNNYSGSQSNDREETQNSSATDRSEISRISNGSTSPVTPKAEPKSVPNEHEYDRKDNHSVSTSSPSVPSSSSLSSSPKTPPSESISSSPHRSPSNDHSSTSGGSEERAQAKVSVGKLVSPRVSQLRQQFLQNDQQASEQQQQGRPIGGARGTGGGGGGVRRWNSMPPREVKPQVIKRETGLSNATVHPTTTTTTITMPSYDHIDNEEELHKLMNTAEDFEERKKIRTRLREIRDKHREEMEAKRKERAAASEDEVKKRFERAEEEKRKKMESYNKQGPTHERESQYLSASQSIIEEKKKLADDDKAKKLAAYSQIAETKTGPGGAKITTTTTKTATSQSMTGGGTRSTMQKTTESSVSRSAGFGGVAYGKPAEETARNISQQLLQTVGSGTSGHMTVKTESWNSSDGVVNKTEKTQTWGAKPQGPQGAMAAFKQMDNATNPSPAKPNFVHSPSQGTPEDEGGLLAVSMAKRAANTMRRNAVAIKQEILHFCKMNTTEYEGVEVTNFSSSWNNGLAFCALIHHFYPDAFDFTLLDSKKRRYNFTLAFDTAEQKADICPLLDVDDMVKMKNPDWKCVFTYVQSIYRHLRDHENNKVMACPVASPEQ